MGYCVLESSLMGSYPPSVPAPARSQRMVIYLLVLVHLAVRRACNLNGDGNGNGNVDVGGYGYGNGDGM